MKNLEQNPSAYCSIDTYNDEEWLELLSNFEDASIYQTGEYAKSFWNKHEVTRIAVFNNDKVIGCAQAVLLKIKFTSRKIAYVQFGPLWKYSGTTDINNLSIVLEFLIKEFAIKRKCILRIVPNIFDIDIETTKRLFYDAGFTINSRHVPYKTLIIDLSASLEDHKKNMRRKWRQTLNKAIKSNLVFFENSDISMFGKALDLYYEMHKRKKFSSFVKMKNYHEAQKILPEKYKFKIYSAFYNGNLCSSLIWSSIGNTSMPVLLASNSVGLKNNAAYLLLWEMLLESKVLGLKYLDVGGIDQIKNPQGYVFKTGFSGKVGTEKDYLGQFDYNIDFFSRQITNSFDYLKLCRNIYKNFIQNIRKTT